MNRALNPSETLILSCVIAPFTAKQVQRVASQKLGRAIPDSTVTGALSNLRRWGYLTSQRRPKVDRKASVVVFRKVAP